MSSNTKSSPYPLPEKGSIRAALLANPTKRLYTHPLEWKAEHLKHLSLQLHPLVLSPHHKVVDEPLPTVPPPNRLQWTQIREAVLDILRHRMERERDELMRSLIAHLFNAITGSPLYKPSSPYSPLITCARDYLPFKYAGRTVAEIPLPLIFCDRQSTPGLAWAYIDGTWSWRERENFHYRRKRSYLHVMRLVREVHDLPLDPIHVAILIALAQKARGARITGASKTSQKVSLFIAKHTFDTSRTPRRFITTTLEQYTTTVTDEYLLKFDDPYHYHDGTLLIYHETLRLDPPLPLCQALERTFLGHDGPLASSTASKKRKALEDITEMANNVQIVLDRNKKRG